jgi:hypothetical protein
VESSRPRLAEAGLFLLLVAVPVAVFPLAVQRFSDLKLVLLLLGALALWVSNPNPSGRLLWPVLAWIGFAAMAAAFGTDPLGSIVGPWEGTGLLLLLACGALAMIAPSLSDAHVDRARSLVVASTSVLAAVALLWAVAPSVFEDIHLDLDLSGSTIGNPVLLAIVLAAGIPAVVATGSSRWAIVVPALLGGAFAANGERSALVLPIVAIVLCLWLLPWSRRRTVAVAAVVLAAGIVWALVRPSASGVRSAGTQFTTVAGEEQRVAELAANARAFLRRPFLGWGPGLAWNGFVSSASAEEMRTATRGWNDAHNLPLQMFETTGLLGGGAFVFVAWLLVSGLARAPDERRWIAASAAVVGLGALYEPLCLSVTPLFFLFAAASYPEPPPELSAARTHRRAVRPAVVAVLGAGVVVATLALAASALEQWGRTHYAEWSLRASLAVEPWRLSADEELATELALDGRAGDAAAAAEARSRISAAVGRHPWDPNVRLVASDVERLLKDFAAAEAWLARQAERFPNDDLSLRPERGT